MSDGNEIPARASQTVGPNLIYQSSSLAPPPSAVAGYVPSWGHFEVNLENTPYADPKNNVPNASESDSLVQQGVIPSPDFYNLSNWGSVFEQDNVHRNAPLLDNSELGNGPHPESAFRMRASGAGQGPWSFQQNSAQLITPPNSTDNSGHDLKRRRRASSPTMPPPQQRSEIVPQVRETRAVPSQQPQKTETAEQKKLDTELRSNLETISKEAGQGDGDVRKEVNRYVELSTELFEDRLNLKNKAKLENTDRRIRRAAQSNRNQQVSKKKQHYENFGLNEAVEVLSNANKRNHAEKQSLTHMNESLKTENQSLKHKVESLEAELRRLRTQLSDSSSVGPPHDGPPGGPPPSDSRRDDSAPDNSNSGWPGSTFRSSGGPTLQGGPASGGLPPSDSMSNAQVPTKFNAQESVGSGELNHCSTPVYDVLPRQSQRVGQLVLSNTDYIPVLGLPNPLSETQRIGRSRFLKGRNRR